MYMHILWLAHRCGACGVTLSGRDPYDKLTTPWYRSLEAIASSVEYLSAPQSSVTRTRGALISDSVLLSNCQTSWRRPSGHLSVWS